MCRVRRRHGMSNATRRRHRDWLLGSLVCSNSWSSAFWYSLASVSTQLCCALAWVLGIVVSRLRSDFDCCARHCSLSVGLGFDCIEGALVLIDGCYTLADLRLSDDLDVAPLLSRLWIIRHGYLGVLCFATARVLVVSTLGSSTLSYSSICRVVALYARLCSVSCPPSSTPRREIQVPSKTKGQGQDED
ncbi:uncharacterized protein C8Q71DRAFT_507007 [Rhodofomes roseus]|uniref:Uncharacterized protein n=1 Tax=Rhodofomes roseus TaxID=34475 RepID=A0ABQ8KMJ4_9APHY|nr:uncharacterized protein C8Q71DRAFT_507007 [Rhodofomes roseus]KAH9839334.1 hypothetical protein C8Q71DRAFT_507007 [Rhodofomes roseus]